MKKLMSALLLACVLLSSSSCGSGTEGAASGTTTGENASTEPETTKEAETELSDNLPDADYGGTTVTILTAAEQWIQYYDSELTGDVVNDAVYERNKAVEERFNVSLNYSVFNGYSAGMAPVKTALSGSVMGGTGDYDLMVGSVSYVTPLISGGLFSDLNKSDYLDFSRPWWYGYVNEQIEIDGRLYLGASAYGLLSTAWADVTFFSKVLVNDYELPDLYQLVNDGSWTYDKMIELAGAVTTDLNGDGIYDGSDILGLISTWDYISFLPSALGYFYTQRGADGSVSLTGANDKMLDINEKIFKLYASDAYLDGNDIKTSGGMYDEMQNIFAGDHALFMIHRLDFASTDTLRNMEDYGIIPDAKYDESQENYITPIVNEVVGIPYVVKDADMSAMLIEALSFESYKTVRPVYFEIALKRKYSRDEDSNKMLDIIMDGVSCDFAYIYVKEIGDQLFYQIGKDENYSSWFAKNQESYQTKIDSLVKAVGEIN